MKQLFTILLILYTNFSLSQNLVPNAGFEEYYNCPANANPITTKQIIPSWHTPIRSSPDYFHACSKYNVGVPLNFMGNVHAFEGNAYIGIITTEKPEYFYIKGKKTLNYREFIQAQLTTPLTDGKKYFVSFSYCIAPYSTYFINHLGIILTDDKIKCQKKLHKCQPICTIDTVITDQTQPGIWYTEIDTIIAEGNERYITLGNFKKDKDIKYLKVDHSNTPKYLKESINTNNVAYYFIDSICIQTIP